MSDKAKYKVMKVFNCQHMPDDLLQQFYDFYKDKNVRNDSYVRYRIHDEEFLPELDAWLIENGATPPPEEDSMGEEVLIKHWW